MTINKDFVIDTEQLIEDYNSFIGYVNNTFKVKISFPCNRVLGEIIKLHLSGMLDNRIFNLFRQFTEDWDEKLLELLTENKLTDDEMRKLMLSVRYRELKTYVQSIVRQVYSGQDPNFTIWDVSVSNNNAYAIIQACGDYRIEQWHHEHHVSKLEIKDVITYDMSHLVGFIYKTFAFVHAPARIKYNPGGNTTITKFKKSFYSELIKNYVGFKLGERKVDEERFLYYAGVLGNQSIVNRMDVDAKIQALDSFFELEVRHQLDKMSDFKQVTSFTIMGEEIIINFGSYKSNERKTQSFAELELQAAEANGDFVPERLRKNRG